MQSLFEIFYWVKIFQFSVLGSLVPWVHAEIPPIVVMTGLSGVFLWVKSGEAALFTHPYVKD